MSVDNDSLRAELEKFPVWEIIRAATALALHDQADDYRNGLEPCLELSELKRALFNAKFDMFANPEVEWWWSVEDAIASAEERKGGGDAI